MHPDAPKRTKTAWTHHIAPTRTKAVRILTHTGVLLYFASFVPVRRAPCVPDAVPVCLALTIPEGWAASQIPLVPLGSFAHVLD